MDSDGWGTLLPDEAISHQSASYDISALDEGLHTILVNCTNASDASNYNDTASVTFTKDTVAPTVYSIVLGDSILTVGENTSLTIIFSEPVRLFTNADITTIANGGLTAVSSVDNVTWIATFTPNVGVEDDTNIINLTLTGLTDVAGNPGVGSNVTLNYVIDTLAPTVAIDYPVDLGYYSSALHDINFTSDAADSCWYTINGGAAVPLDLCDNAIAVNFSSDGSKTLIVFANDSLNNIGNDTITFTIDTLNVSKLTALGVLNATLASYNESNYNNTNWIILNGFKTDGDAAIAAALNLSAVISARNNAVDGMAGVETIAETLAAAKLTALGVLNDTLATYNESDYFDSYWDMLTGFKYDGDSDIVASTDLDAVINNRDATIASMANVPTIAEIFDNVSSALYTAGIANNLSNVTPSNINNFSGLYFEKRTNVTNASTAIGKIAFTSGLNLSSNETQAFLQNLGTKMDASSAGIIGLNLSGATNSLTLKNVSATITFYRLINSLGFNSSSTAAEISSKLIAFDDNGNIISKSTLVLTNGTYNANCEVSGGCYVLNVTHFTKYKIDNTVPTVTIVDPSDGHTFNRYTTSINLTVTTNENATCRYHSGSDANYSGMSPFSTTGGLTHNKSVTVAAASSITSYTYYIRCQDVAGNTMVSSEAVQFYVAKLSSSSSSSSSNSNSDSYYTPTTTTSDPSKSMGYTLLPAGSKVISINSSSIPLSEILLTTLSSATNVRFVVTVTTSPTTTYTGTVYKYLKIDHDALNNSNIGNAKLKFKIEKSWLTTNGKTKNDIFLFRYTTQWDELVTTIVSEDSTYVYYQADSPGLSLFAISTKKTAVVNNAPVVNNTPTPVVNANTAATNTNSQVGNATPVNNTTKPSAVTKSSTSRIIVWCIAMLVVALLLYLSLRKPKK